MSTPLSKQINGLFVELLDLAVRTCNPSTQAAFKDKIDAAAEAINAYALNAIEVIDRQDNIILQLSIRSTDKTNIN
jgi:hypothetical protein